MKTKPRSIPLFSFRSTRLVLLMAFSVLVPLANALPDGSAPKLTGLKISTPAGDAVEMSTENDSLSSVSLEVSIEADKNGVRYFGLVFRSPDGKRRASFWGSGNDTPAKSNPLLARDETNQTFVLGAGDLDKFDGWQGFDRPLDQPGVWTLDSAYLLGGNDEWVFLSADLGNLPTGLIKSFRVTRWFERQPAFTSVVNGGTLSLAPQLDFAAVVSPSYQWFRNGTAISGATQQTFSKTKATAADAGLYYLEVTSGGIKVRSDAVPVSVRSADVVAARSAINLQDAVVAKQRAQAALNLSPNGGEERFVSALSELLAVLTDSSTQALLADMGASVTPKSPFADFKWAGAFPATANTSKFSQWVLSVFLPAVERADSALEQITDPRFVTWVSAADFGKWTPEGDAWDGNLLVDYGDIQVLRVGLNALSAFFRLWTTLDTSVRLDALEMLLSKGSLSVESILKDYPSLLAAAADGAANQVRSVDAMTRAAAAYKRFSDFVYNSSGTVGAVTRYVDGNLNLFNVQRQFAEDGIIGLENEPYFRDLFANISESAAVGTKYFIAESKTGQGVVGRYPVNLKALKERPAGLRGGGAAQNFVPAFSRNLAGGVVSNGSLSGVLPLLDARRLMQRLVAYEPEITKALRTREDESAPVLDLTAAPASGSKIFLGSDGMSVRLAGTVQDESAIEGVFLESTVGSVTTRLSANLTELSPGQLNGKVVRKWGWTIDLPASGVGLYAYLIYATDQYKQRSVPKSGMFVLARMVGVAIIPPDPLRGTLTITPPIPPNGLVETGTRLVISALPKSGYLLQTLGMMVNGVSIGGPPRMSTEVFVSGTMVLKPNFVANPFPQAAGQWTGRIPSSGTAAGFLSVVVTKTGAFTLRLTQGRNTFTRVGVMDPSGYALVNLPSTFLVPDADGFPQAAPKVSFRIENGVKFSFGTNAGIDSGALARAATASEVAGLRSRRFNAALGGANKVGYAGFDVATAGAVLSTGMLNLPGTPAGGVGLPGKTVKFSSSTPLVMVPGDTPTPQAVPGLNFYAVASDIALTGPVSVDGGTLSGTLDASIVRTAPVDSTQPISAVASYGVFPLAGYAYIAPTAGQLVPPFSAGGKTSFTVLVAEKNPLTGVYNPGTSVAGELRLNGDRPAFRYNSTTETNGSAPVLKGASMNLAAAKGSFSGILATQGSTGILRRSYFGVVLRPEGPSGVGPLAVGMSADGLLIYFQ